MYPAAPTRTRYITACSQLLALGVVIAILTPAANVVSLDVVIPEGQAVIAQQKSAIGASVVAAEPADAEITEVQITAPENGRIDPEALEAEQRPGDVEGGSVLVSDPQPVEDFGTVGVTWDADDDRDEGEIDVEVRTRTDGDWSSWSEAEYHDEHGPDPQSAEAAGARPGTEPLVVGDVDEVQVKVRDETEAPDDLQLAIIEPGEEPDTELAEPEIDTSTLDGAPSAEAPAEGAAVASAAAAASKPQIFSRQQWGANEAWRDKGSLRYGTIQGAFVHHTVNANDYTKSEVPGLLRSIYAYHTKSRGWSDVGYNFLVDRFGRIWEGRAGGVDRAVVGAHTLNYNDYSFAMSAIGNFETAKPTTAMLKAYGALFAWKLGMAGVNPQSTRVKIGSGYFKAINGHRDAGSTACPGRYLYEKLGAIRTYAGSGGGGTTPPPTPQPPATPQPQAWSGRSQSSNLAASRFPDLIVRRASDGKGVILPTGGLTRFSKGGKLPTGWGKAKRIVGSPDLTGDGRSDVVVLRRDGKALVRPGNGKGRFGKSRKTLGVFKKHTMLTAVGDLDGSGTNDLVAKNSKNGRLNVFLGGGKGGFFKKPLAGNWAGYNQIAATGDLTGDGLVDVLGRDKAGKLWLHPGTGRRALGPRRQVPGAFGGFDTITGFGDFTRDGVPDLFLRRKSDKLGYIVAGRGDGTFAPPLGPFDQFKKVRHITGGGQYARSGYPDLIGRQGKKLRAFAGTANYNLGGPIETSLNLKNASAVVNAGDFNGDGLGDVITRNVDNGGIFLRAGNGQGTFGNSIPLGSGFEGFAELTVPGDLTRDGRPDLVATTSSGATVVYPGNGTSALGAPLTGASRSSRSGVQLGPYDWIVEVSDLDGDSRPDLVVRERSTQILYTLRRSSSGFYARSFLGERLGAYDLAG